MNKKDNKCIIYSTITMLVLILLSFNLNNLFKPVQEELPEFVYKDLSQFSRLNEGTNPNGKITVVEFIDFECPFCKDAFESVKEILALYGTEINLVIKHFPLESIHSNALKAAEASECARDQNMFFEYHNILFENSLNLGINDLKRFAKQLELDQTKFDHCLDSGEKNSIVKKDQEEAILAGVKGTPTFIVNGMLMQGTVTPSQIKVIIDQENIQDGTPIPEIRDLN